MVKKIAFLFILALCAPGLLWAHGFAGKRFFPTTLTIDDPFVADELSIFLSHIEEPGEGQDSSVQATVVSGELSKRVTQHLGISLGWDVRHLNPETGKTEAGVGNLELGAKYQFLASDPHEAILSIGLDTELGGTGGHSVHAESFSTISPALFFGKGLGDLPDSMRYFKPLAITGRVACNFPTRSKNVATHIDHGTGEGERQVEQNPNTLSWGLTIQYDFHYLQSFVRDAGLGVPFNRTIVIVELPLETCLNRGCADETTGTVNPGFIWFGKSLQLGIEAVIPINHQTGKNVGVLGLLHFYLDDLFPRTLGKPIFRRPR